MPRKKTAAKNNFAKDWNFDFEKHVQEIATDSGESYQAQSAEMRQEVRNRVAALRGVDPKSISYPRSNDQLAKYEDEIYYAEQEVSNKASKLREIDSSYSCLNNQLSTYKDEIYHAELSYQAKSAKMRQQVRNKVAELRGVNPKSIPYPRSNEQLAKYENEIYYAKLSHQAKSAEIRKEVRNEVAELKGVDPKLIPHPRSNDQLSEHEDDYDKLSDQAKSEEIRKEVRNEIGELKGVDPKSIPYPHSNDQLSEYEDDYAKLSDQAKSEEIRKEPCNKAVEPKRMEQRESQEEFQLAEQMKNLHDTLKNNEIEDNQIKAIPKETVISDHNKETCHDQIIEKSNVKSKQIEKKYSISHSDIMAIVDISYREDKGGKAAFWDHYTFQRITNYPTRVVGTNNNARFFKDEIRDKTYGLPISPIDPYKPTPPIIGLYPYPPNDFHGLLLIPGSHSDSNKCPNYEDRMKNEEKLIKDAWNRGRPVLGICDGGLKIWKLFGGEEVKVHNHSERAMPYLTQNGRVGRNIEMHHLRIKGYSILAGAMYGKAAKKLVATNPVANSVHNKAMSPKIVPSNMEVTARSIERADKAPSNRSPEENVIEAAETCHGAPMLLIQWHPEAFNADDTDGKYHRSILTYMAKAGDTYYRKQEMLMELKKSPEGLVKSARKQTKKNKTVF